jgi:Tol biopolymer transport system component
MRPDGERVRRITARGGFDPSFSPHASRIAFVRRSQVYTVGARGGGLDRVTGRGGLSPSWSPNGRRIAFLRFRGRAGIYRVGPRGGALRRIQRLVADYACDCFYENSLDWGPRR